MATSRRLQNISPADLAQCLFNESHDALLIFDPGSLQIIDVNARAEQRTRRSRNQLLQLKLPALFDTDAAGRLRDYFDGCLQGCDMHAFQACRLASDCDGPIDVEVAVSRLNEMGNGPGLLTIRDISDLQARDDGAKEAWPSIEAVGEHARVRPIAHTDDPHADAEWLRELIDDLDAIVWEAELPTWRFTYVSRHAEKVLGYPVSSWLSENDFWVNHLHSDDRERCIQVCTNSTVRGEDHEFECRAIAKDGRIVWLRDIVRVVQDAFGEPFRLRGVMIDITEQKKSEEALRESEEQRRRTEEIALVMNVNVGLDGCWLKVQPGFCHYLGYSRNELIGRHWREVTHPDDSAECERQDARLLAGDIRTYERVKRFITKDGRTVWSYFNSSLVVNRAGEPQFFKIYVRDATKEKAAEKALQQSEARYRALVQNAPVCIHEIDLDGRLQSINRAGLRMLGLQSDRELIGQCYLSFVDEKRRQRIGSLLEKAFRGKTSTFEFALSLEGQRRILASNFVPIINQEGDVKAVMGTSEDITERRLAEEALRDSEERYRRSEQRLQHLISQSPVALYACKAFGDYGASFVSESIKLQTGYEAHQFTDDPNFWAEHIHPDDRDRVFAELARLPDQRKISCDYRFLHRDGTYRWMHDQLSIPEGRGGGAEEIVGFWIDVTERKLAEEQLCQKELQLTHVSRLSTLGEMVAGIAHEINQPLSAIANFAAAARNTLAKLENDDVGLIESWLEQVTDQAVRCGDIIRRLRNYVTKDRDRLECVELNQVVRDSVALINSNLLPQAVVIECQLSEPGPRIMASEVQLQQVTLNLLRNACDAALESAAPRVSVSVEMQNGSVRLSVEDNGSGVAELHRPKLFDPFFTTKANGMGMGLPISKSIVEAHGGTLRLDTAHSNGCRFHAEFPAADSSQPVDVKSE